MVLPEAVGCEKRRLDESVRVPKGHKLSDLIASNARRYVYSNLNARAHSAVLNRGERSFK